MDRFRRRVIDAMLDDECAKMPVDRRSDEWVNWYWERQTRLDQALAAVHRLRADHGEAFFD